MTRVNQLGFGKYLLAILAGYFLFVLSFQLSELVEGFVSASGPVMENAAPLGGDFSIFYTAGKIFRNSPENLYNFEYQLVQLRSIFQNTSQRDLWLVFIYPPHVAALFSIFADLELRDAYVLWIATSLIIFTVAFWQLKRACKIPLGLSIFLFLGSVSFVPFLMNTLGGGQLSIFGFLIFSLMIAFRRGHREFSEGLCLGLGFYKPPLFLFLGILAVIEKRWKVVLGALTSLVLQLCGCLALVGKNQLISYFTTAINYRYGQQVTPGVVLPPVRGVGLVSLLFRTFSDNAMVYGILFVLLLILAALIAHLNKRVSIHDNKSDLLIFALSSTISVTLSIQCINYDLVLLLPALVIVCFVLNRSKASILGSLLGITALLIHQEWHFRTTKLGLEYAPAVPYLLILFILTLVIYIFRETSLQERKY